MNKLKIEHLSLKKIKPYSKNPRKNEKAIDTVAKSIANFGFKNPIILDKNNEIVAGHTRIKSIPKAEHFINEKIDKAKKDNKLDEVSILKERLESLKKLPTIKADDLSPDQIKAFRIMDNKSHEKSDWDWELLKGEIETIEDMDMTGFSEAEIEKILDQSDDFTIGKKEPKYKINPGDMYQMGPHRIICGNSTDPKVYEKLLEKKSVQLVFTDPPYGVSYKGMANQCRRSPKRGNDRKWDVIEGDDLRGEDLYELIKESFEQVNEYLQQDGAIYVFHSSSNQIIFEKALNEANFEVKQQLIWNKHHVLGRSHYHWCHEPIFYGCRINEQPKFYGTRTNRTILTKMDIDSMKEEELKKLLKKIKKESTVWEIKKENSKDYIHPTQKPPKLAERALVNSSNKGDNVLDPFAGSGSTLIACDEKERNCFLIELDPGYCSLIIERWEEFTKKKAIKQ